MAKRIVKWTLDGNILKLSKTLENNENVVIEAEFDTEKMFPEIGQMTDVQRQLCIYGIKQKLMDTGASELGDPDGKITSAKKKFQELLDGKWSGERLNATGAAENKKVLSAAKEASKVVSLEGLIVKKTLYPNTFTAEDQAKLDEFMGVVKKHGKTVNVK